MVGIGVDATPGGGYPRSVLRHRPATDLDDLRAAGALMSRAWRSGAHDVVASATGLEWWYASSWPDVLADLAARGHRLKVIEENYATFSFARPNGIAIDPATGRLTGGVNQFTPSWAMGY